MRRKKRKVTIIEEVDVDKDIDFWTPNLPIHYYCPRDGEKVTDDGYWILESEMDHAYTGFCSELCYLMHRRNPFEGLTEKPVVRLYPPPIPL
jgi:hypothetical protein